MKNYYRNFCYDPVSARFIQKDPIGLRAGDTNLYRYVGNNPVNFTDPLGLEFTAPVITSDKFIEFISSSAGQTAIDRKFGAESDQQYRFVQVGKQVVDMRHAAAAYNQTISLMENGVPGAFAGAVTYGLGIGVEIDQLSGGRISNVLSNQSIANTQPSLGDNPSAFSSEDIPSNVFGIEAAKSGLGLGGSCSK